MKTNIRLFTFWIASTLSSALAATTTYTQSSAFFAALNAANSFSIRPTETYESYGTNTQILEGGTLGLYSYSGFPAYNEVTISGRIDALGQTAPQTGFYSVAGGIKNFAAYATPTPPAQPVAVPDYFFNGESFTVILPSGTRAIGIFFNAVTTPNSNDLFIETAAGIATNGLLNYDTVQSSNDAFGSKNLYFVGLISDSAFGTAEIGQALGGGTGWVVDNLTTARSKRDYQMTAASANLWTTASWTAAVPDSTTNGDTAELVGATNTVTGLDSGTVKIGTLQTNSAASGGNWTITSSTNSLKMDNGVNPAVIQNLRTGSSNFVVDVDLSLSSNLVVTGVSDANSNVTLGVAIGAHSITGTKNLTLAGVAGGGVLTINDNINIVGVVSNLSASGIHTIAGMIGSGVTGLTQNGASILMLSGNNAFSGGTTIGAGTLNVNADAALGAPGGGVAIRNGATLQAGGTVVSGRTFTLGADGGRIDTHGSEVTLSASSTVTGTALTKMGAGTLNLNGALSFATLLTNGGMTNVNAPIGNGTAVVKAGATTNFSVSQTLASLEIGAGSFFGTGETALAAVVPEPGALSLLVLGALGAAARRRRR